MSTATLHGAREHARGQAGATAATQRTVPASQAAHLPSGVAPNDALWEETIAAGGYAARSLPTGAMLRIDDLDGDGCVHLVVHNARSTIERLNVADTVKVQWQAYLDTGAVLLSDMGRALMTITSDTSSRHDALCGAMSAAQARSRFGGSGIHSATPTARELLTVAAAKYGLEPRDLPTGINLFKSATVSDDGTLRFDGAPRPGTAVELRAEMDVLVLLAAVPHPLDPRPSYTCSTVRCVAWRGARPGPDDPFRATSPERQRAYENTDDAALEVR